MVRLRKEEIKRIEELSNIKESVEDLLKEGFDKIDIIRYIKDFKTAYTKK